jgi:hypothetical protein
MYDDGFLAQEEWLTFRSIPSRHGYPFLDFIREFERRHHVQLRVVMRMMDIATSRGTTASGRMSVVDGSECRLLYIRIVPSGRSPLPRAFAVRRRNTIWFATGFMKSSRAIPGGAIADAEALIRDWIGRGEPENPDGGGNA